MEKHEHRYYPNSRQKSGTCIICGYDPKSDDPSLRLIKIIRCIDCKKPSVYNFAGLPVGFCNNCSLKALSAALLVKMTQKEERGVWCEWCSGSEKKGHTKKCEVNI